MIKGKKTEICRNEFLKKCAPRRNDTIQSYEKWHIRFAENDENHGEVKKKRCRQKSQVKIASLKRNAYLFITGEKKANDFLCDFHSNPMMKYENPVVILYISFFSVWGLWWTFFYWQKYMIRGVVSQVSEFS